MANNKRDISTHTLRKEGDEKRRTVCTYEHISTHTLRKEGDGQITVVITTH